MIQSCNRNDAFPSRARSGSMLAKSRRYRTRKKEGRRGENRCAKNAPICESLLIHCRSASWLDERLLKLCGAHREKVSVCCIRGAPLRLSNSMARMVSNPDLTKTLSPPRLWTRPAHKSKPASHAMFSNFALHYLCGNLVEDMTQFRCNPDRAKVCRRLSARPPASYNRFDVPYRAYRRR